MVIDYGKWRDGEPYDIPALSEVTPEERDLLVDEICEHSGSLDWRDVEALRALATPKAIKRVGLAAAEQTDGAGIEAFMDDIAREGFHGHAAELAGLARCVGCPDCDASVAARFSGDDNEWLAAQAESLWEKTHLP